MIVRMLRPRIKAVRRKSEVRLVQMIDRMIAPWRPAVAEMEDSLNLIVSDAKQEARKQIGLMEFRFQPYLVDRGRVSAQSGSRSIRTRCMAAANCQARSTTRPRQFTARVRKAVEPRAQWQMRPRPEPNGSHARQQNARRTRHSHWRPSRVAASLPGLREPWRELQAWLRRSVQPTEA
jgi:hypothetical protein